MPLIAEHSLTWRTRDGVPNTASCGAPQIEGQLAEGHKPFFVFFASTRKPGTETKVEASPSPASTTRWFGANERMRFSNGLQHFKKRAFAKLCLQSRSRGHIRDGLA